MGTCFRPLVVFLMSMALFCLSSLHPARFSRGDRIGALSWEAACAQSAPPPGASVSVKVQVPASMRAFPFDADRYLNVPPNFTIAVYARISGARFMAIAPSGDLLVSQPGAGKVILVRPNPTGGDPSLFDFATGLRRPHDIVFHAIGQTTYVYIAETHQINRYIYHPGDTAAQNREIVVTGLPDSVSTPGGYGHELKNIALDASHNLYVSIGSATNASAADTTADPVRASIYIYNADGTNGRLFARGLRNAEGLAVLPGTNQLWVVVNNRDNIRYPYNDSTGYYGQVVPDYVDNHPPDEFTRVRDGGNYGWPFANPNPDTSSGMDSMPFDPDYDNNRDGSVFNVNTFDRITKGIKAHSAPLGLLLLQDTPFPALYKEGALVGLHGSWNRQRRTGYKVIYFPWDRTTQLPGGQIDLVNGWLDDATQQAWGRPVDIAVDQDGNLLISDDNSGTIYKLTYTQKADTRLYVTPRSGLPGYPAAFFGVLSRIPDGAHLNNKLLTIKLDGQTLGTAVTGYLANSGEMGAARLDYGLPATMTAGAHTITVEFAGDANNNPITGTGTLTVGKADTYLYVTPRSGKPGQRVAFYGVLSRNIDHSVKLNNRTLTFKLDGTTIGTATTGYIADSNEYGAARLDYTLPANISAGSHTITVAFAGDTNNNPTTKTGTLTANP